MLYAPSINSFNEEMCLTHGENAQRRKAKEDEYEPFVNALRLCGKYFLSRQLAAVFETELLPKLGTQICEPSKTTEKGPLPVE